MRIVFVIKNPGFLRYLQTQIEGLLEAGADVHLAVQDQPVRDEDGLLELFARRWPRQVSVGFALSRQDHWAPMAKALRRALDQLHYLHPDYIEAKGLKARRRVGASRGGAAAQAVLEASGLARSRTFARLSVSLLRGLYASIPPAAEVRAYIQQLDADLLVVSGLVWPGSAQADYVQAAQVCGVPTAYIVNSWDNLTNKGDMKVVPDRVYVWNEEQVREARDHHGVPASAIVMTGAPLFDRWYARAPQEDRDSFCRRVGLPDDGPFILYACSSPSIAPVDTEVTFFRKWLAALRASPDERLRDINVLARPHPFNTAPWAAFDPKDPRVIVHPRDARWVVREADRDEYFHVLSYASALVGLNTSAMIEAAIRGAPTFSLQSGDFASMQAGTLHFPYLQRHGVVDVQEDMAAHLASLGNGLADQRQMARPPLPGVAALVRPMGSEIAATPLAVAALREQARGEGARLPAPFAPWRPLLRLVVEIDAFCKALSKDHGTPLEKAPKARKKKTKTPLPNEIAEAQAVMAAAAARDAFVVFGPWRGGGAEQALLYWIPFLRWLRKSVGFPKERIVIVSSGAARWWYGGIIGQQMDVLTLYSRAELDVLDAERGQAGDEVIDRRICEAAAERLGLERYEVFSPGELRGLFARAEGSPAAQTLLSEYSRTVAISPPPAKVAVATKALPERYVVIGFDPPDLERVGEALATRSDVVVIDEGTQAEAAEARTAMLARSAGYLGTCGDDAWLAVMLGKPAVYLQGGDDPLIASRVAWLRRQAPELADLMQIAPSTDLAALEGLIARLLSAPGHPDLSSTKD